VNSFGGLEKQYQVLVDQAKTGELRLSLRQVIEALERNNSNAAAPTSSVRASSSLCGESDSSKACADIENIVVLPPRHAHHRSGHRRSEPGSQVRQGAATRDGRGETGWHRHDAQGRNSRTVTSGAGQARGDARRCRRGEDQSLL